jgi:AcrR family transcriptional regulator
VLAEPVSTGQAPAPARRGRGRPRDPSKDAAVLAAVRQSLIEDGFEGTTIPAVARRAGIGAPTIYRRWPTQIDLVEAIFDEVFSADVEVLSDEYEFPEAVYRIAEGAFRFFGDPAARQAIPGLLVAYNGDPSRYAALTHRTEIPARKVFRRIHSRAEKQGLVSKRPDSDTLFSTITAAALLYGAIRGESGPATMRSIIDLALKASRP